MNGKKQSSEWLSLHDAAELLGVHPSTVRSWANQGKLDVHRTQGGHRRFRREDVEVWLHTQQHNGSIEFNSVADSALKRMRLEISEGRLENADWYRKLDVEARDQYRKSGRSLLLGVVGYMSDQDVISSAEARSLGYEYASRGWRLGLSRVEAVNAFMFFRNMLMESMLSFYETAGVYAPKAWSDMVRKIQAFTDQIMLALLETYEAYQKGSR